MSLNPHHNSFMDTIIPSDIYMYIFTITKLRLRDIITLTEEN
jgi:hypothetical protein